MLQALRDVYTVHPNIQVLWKVVKCDGVKVEDLPYLRQVDWLDSIEEVYTHPAVKVVIHHGGGKFCPKRRTQVQGGVRRLPLIPCPFAR